MEGENASRKGEEKRAPPLFIGNIQSWNYRLWYVKILNTVLQKQLTSQNFAWLCVWIEENDFPLAKILTGGNVHLLRVVNIITNIIKQRNPVQTKWRCKFSAWLRSLNLKLINFCYAEGLIAEKDRNPVPSTSAEITMECRGSVYVSEVSGFLRHAVQSDALLTVIGNGDGAVIVRDWHGVSIVTSRIRSFSWLLVSHLTSWGRVV